MSASVRRVAVAGAELPYVECGEGAPLILLHAALTDHGMWEPHLAPLSRHFRVIAPTQRYCGSDDWDAAWPPFGVETHAEDLVAMLRAFACGPAHLVAWSYSAHVALCVALRHSELVASVYLYEPGFPSYLDDPAELAVFETDVQAMFGPVFEAVGRGDMEEGVRRLVEGSGGAGYFARQPEQRRDMQLRHARTLPLLLSQAQPPTITSQDLARLSMPVAVAWGAHTRPLFKTVARAASRATPDGVGGEVASAGHMWPEDDPPGFTEAIAAFVKLAGEAR